jgi:EAL domain-containing protein (putative c-di-GMP-specific phosphodiesterase class I)
MFAQKHGSKLIAEGIETEGELETLRGMGVRYGQGFLLAMPTPGFEAAADLPAALFAR